MLDLRQRLGIPLAVATIPATTEAALTQALGSEPEVTVVQHGYDHRNHAAPGAKKAELAEGRDPAVVVANLKKGRGQLEGLFGKRFRTVLVPPWNRIDPNLIAYLPEAGFQVLSGFSGKKTLPSVPGLLRADCHIDVIDWHGNRGFIGTSAALDQAVAALGRARGVIGLLTHHRVMDRPAWNFVATFADRVAAKGGRWTDVIEAAKAGV